MKNLFQIFKKRTPDLATDGAEQMSDGNLSERRENKFVSPEVTEQRRQAFINNGYQYPSANEEPKVAGRSHAVPRNPVESEDPKSMVQGARKNAFRTISPSEPADADTEKKIVHIPGGKIRAPVSRRDFLQKTALITTAAIATPAIILNEVAKSHERKRAAVLEEAPLAYQASMHPEGNEPRELLREGKEGVLGKTVLQPETLVVDGGLDWGDHGQGPNSNVLHVAAGVKQLYLNQALLKDAARVEVTRSSEYVPGETANGGIIQHLYTLSIVDHANGPRLFVEYGPLSVKANPGLGERADFFPDVHFFQSDGDLTLVHDAEGNKKPLVLKGDQLLADMPMAQVEWSPSEDGPTGVVKNAHTAPEDLLLNYIGTRTVAKSNKRSATYDEFKTDEKPVPLAELNDKNILGKLAATLHAEIAPVRGQTK